MSTKSDATGGEDRLDRRAFLSMAGAAMVPAGVAAPYGYQTAFVDRDGDGIPDALERSEAFHTEMVNRFGSQFEGLDPTRRDLLIDARIVGDRALEPSVESQIRMLFRENGIHLQWLNHPTRYDTERFQAVYGINARKMLWGRNSFYRTRVDETLRNVAFQLIITPGKPDEPYMGRVYSPYARYVLGGHTNGWVNGINVGNRAVIGYREDPREQARLALHEISHLVLCHDYHDPTNHGVMGTHEEIDLTDHEWRRMRNNLHRIRDRTGYDVALRRCLWRNQLGTFLF